MIAWLKRMLQTNALTHDAAPAVTHPETTMARQLALVIDLNVCVGCHACVTSCKEWNTAGAAGPLSDQNTRAAGPTGYALMPEWETQPANQYLPRRPTAAKV